MPVGADDITWDEVISEISKDPKNPMNIPEGNNVAGCLLSTIHIINFSGSETNFLK